MSKIKFVYMNKISIVKLEKETSFTFDILIYFSGIIQKDIKELYFTYKGNILEKNNLSKYSNTIKDNDMIIFVFNYNSHKNIEKPFCPICPKCKNLTKLIINEDKLSLYCDKNHYYSDLTIDEYINSQNEEPLIKCDICKNNNYYYNKFYICSCGINICPLCRHSHDNICHSNINYFNRFYQCFKHSKMFSSYCLTCKTNLCVECEGEHIKHKLNYYKEIIPNLKKLNEIKKELKDFENNINLFKKDLLKLDGLFSDFIININKNVDGYFKLNENMLICLEFLYNYETIKNITDFRIKKFNKNMINILNEQNYKNKLKILLDIYDIANNEMKIEYNIKNVNDSRIRLFGEKFVKINKNNCFLLINGNKTDLCEYYYFDKKTDNHIIKVDLIEKRKIINMSSMFSECNALCNFDISKYNTIFVQNMSGMFSNCKLLKALPNDISKFNTSSLINISYFFYNCENLINLPDISKWDTSNISHISHIFNKCSNLLQLPDISKWNLNKVKDLNGIFNECSSLKSLPDISKWEIKSVINMNGTFNKCSSLTHLPDISKWNTNKVKDMTAIFQSCSSLKSLPNISKWNTFNVTNISGIFNKCLNLQNIPDISKWDISNVIDMSALFQNCCSITCIPNISKWKTSNIKNMSYLFNECINLNDIPNISNWDTKNVIYMIGIFSNCSKLDQLPDISKWNTNNVQNFGHIFNGCKNLTSLPDISNWSTNNVKCLSAMFQNCSSLISLPDISKWNTDNVTDISYLFNKCTKLEIIPDISKWNTKNISNMSYLFNECISLTQLPDISNWDIENVIYKKSFDTRTSILSINNSILDNNDNIKSKYINK